MPNEYVNSYIAFLDILGFKELVRSHTCPEIVKIFDEINTQYLITCDETHQPLVSLDNVHLKVMSDSICLYIPTSVDNSLPVLVGLCAYLQVRLWRLERPILVRGGIVQGNIYANGDVTFGTGLTNAYLLEERNAKVPRIIITKETIDSCTADPSSKAYMEMLLIRDYDAFYFIDSFAMLYVWGQKDESYIRFCDHIQKILNSTTDDSVREKYLYLESKINQIAYRVKSGEGNPCPNKPQA